MTKARMLAQCHELIFGELRAASFTGFECQCADGSTRRVFPAIHSLADIVTAGRWPLRTPHEAEQLQHEADAVGSSAAVAERAAAVAARRAPDPTAARGMPADALHREDHGVWLMLVNTFCAALKRLFPLRRSTWSTSGCRSWRLRDGGRRSTSRAKATT